jgi:hypothetical protein
MAIHISADRLHLSIIFLNFLHEYALMNSASSDLHVSTVHVSNLHARRTCSRVLLSRTIVRDVRQYVVDYDTFSLFLLGVSGIFVLELFHFSSNTCY